MLNKAWGLILNSTFKNYSRLNYRGLKILNGNLSLNKKSLTSININNNLISRNFSISCKKLNEKKSVNIVFIDRDGDQKKVKALVGTSLLDVAIDNNVDLEGFGACEGTLSCSTCHLILNKENYDSLKPPTDEENDMLDLAYGLTPTSRLGCQVNVTENMEGWMFVVPKEVSDARS